MVAMTLGAGKDLECRKSEKHPVLKLDPVLNLVWSDGNRFVVVLGVFTEWGVSVCATAGGSSA